MNGDAAELAAVFVERNGAARLLGSRCPHCSAVAFPATVGCRRCGAATSESELSGAGTVHASTIVHVAPAGFNAGYAVAMVDLREGPRVFGILEGAEAGDDVQALPAVLPSGIIGYVFGVAP